LFVSHNHLIGIKNSNNILNLNTKYLRPIYSFGIGIRTFVISRGLDSISFDELHELVEENGNYELKYLFKLPYSTNNIEDKDGYITIAGDSWKIQINKELMVIEKGSICSTNVLINHGI